jgi:prepilin-type N-terminal cleavage/methylation domain-containing protein
MKVSLQRAFSLLESVISLAITSILMAMIGSFALSVKNISSHHSKRSELTQNLQGIINYLSLDARLAGENLAPNFPAVLLSNSPLGSILTLRRSLSQFPLPLCQDISAGSSLTRILVAKNGLTENGCSVSANLTAFNDWRNFALSKGFPIRVYLYDFTTREGLFLPVQGFEMESDSLFLMLSSPHTFDRSFQIPSSIIYLLEQLTIRRDNQNRLLLNIDNENLTYTLGFNVSSLNIQIQTDSSLRNTFTAAENWTKIQFINFELQSSLSLRDQTLSETVNFRLLPRNVLSFNLR